jgi:hypothetical protein
VAFRRQDDAHPLWRGRQRCPIFCVDSTFRADPVGHLIGILRLDSVVVDQTENEQLIHLPNKKPKTYE